MMTVRARAAELLVRSDYLRCGVLGQRGERLGRAKRVQLDLRLSLRPAPQVVESPVPFVRYEIDLAHSLGVLSLDACTHNDLFEQTLQQFMTEVARNRIQKIAIDLRQNRGGDATVALSFLRYIPKMYSAFSVELRSSADLLKQIRRLHLMPTYKRLLRSESMPSCLLYHSGSRHCGAPFVFASDGGSESSVFRKALCLTGPQTWSSANLFTLLVKDNQLGQQVGESIGNERTYGQQLSFELSGTHFLFHSASSRNIRPNPKLPNDRAVVPDVEVPLLRSDVLRDRDPVRAYIESL
ncbi:MAG: S41 family peptidase [Polyangia bacterium]